MGLAIVVHSDTSMVISMVTNMVTNMAIIMVTDMDIVKPNRYFTLMIHSNT